mgnify:CR=1 FL=1
MPVAFQLDNQNYIDGLSDFIIDRQNSRISSSYFEIFEYTFFIKDVDSGKGPLYRHMTPCGNKSATRKIVDRVLK